MAAAIAAHNAAQRSTNPFDRANFRRRSTKVRRQSSAVLEDIAEVLPAPSLWLREADVKKLSHKGKWEERNLIVAEDKIFVSRSGRVLEAIPLDGVRRVKAVTPRDPQSTANDVAKWNPKALERQGSFPSLRAEQMGNDGWKSSRIVRMVSSSRDLRASAHAERTDGPHDCCFEIETFEGGQQWGRTYIFMLDTTHQRNELMAFLTHASTQALKRTRNKSRLRRWQIYTRSVYESFLVQVSVALLIIVAFVIQVWESEAFPEDGTAARTIIDSTDALLTVIFTIELAVNFFSSFFLPFVENPWNIFDTIIVSVSIVSLILSSVPGLGALRLLRTFRVLRLFGRLGSFRRIVSALGAAMLPVANAFVVVLLMVSVFAIMGVFLFREKAPEFFGSFSVSFFTMFTISTVDGWVDVVYVAAPETLDWGKIYFIAYILVVVWTLLPVVVAVLLDKFTEVMAKEKERSRRARMPAFKPVTSSALDPILMTLTDFESDDNLSQRIRLLFEALDAESRGSLTYWRISESLRTLRMGKNVRISEEDFEELTQNGRLLDSNGGLSVEMFEFIVRAELRDYLQRQLAGELLKCEEHSMSAPILSSLKLLLLRDGLLSAGGGGAESDQTCSPLVASLVSPRPTVQRQSSPSSMSATDAKTQQRKLPLRQSPAPPGPNSETRVATVRDVEAMSTRDALIEGGMMDDEPEEEEEEGEVPLLPGQVEDVAAPSTIAVEPVQLEKAPGGGGEEQEKVEKLEGRGADVRELTKTVKHMETLLLSVLKGQQALQGTQQRLEQKVDKLDGEVGRLAQGHAEVKAQVQKIPQTLSAPAPAPAGLQGNCDICQDEAASKNVGRARVCALCASLLTDGQI